jgi:3-methylfumaryl-CoA hydratase
VSGLADWTPEPLETAGTVAEWPGAAFAALLDLPEAPGVGDLMPPLWHWLHLLDHPRRSELGDDGHPAHGRFFPPMPHRRRMIAGGRLRVVRPLRVGDEVVRRSSLASVEVKTGRSGEMVFVTVRSEFRRVGSPDVLLTEEQDVVYRSQPPGRPRAEQPEEAAEDRPSDWRLETPTDPALLFRFSALTYNTHRIHYDQPYATGVEGYPDLVVHGPLLALLLLEIPRRHRPEATVTGFDYRLSRPVFCGATVIARGSADGPDRLSLSAAATGAATAITASATLTPGTFGTESP